MSRKSIDNIFIYIPLTLKDSSSLYEHYETTIITKKFKQCRQQNNFGRFLKVDEPKFLHININHCTVRIHEKVIEILINFRENISVDLD